VPYARRAAAVERSLNGQRAEAASFASAAARVSEGLGSDVHGDIFASAEYRAAMAPVYIKRALAAAAARAGLG
jgi:carbon-monoxide dehydrogenase medium subunit